MNHYAFQPLEQHGEPIADETTHMVNVAVSQETLREQARQLALSVGRSFPDDRPWTGWSIEVFSKLGDAPRERQVLTFEELMA